MNSESYGAYNNWLKERRKASPVFVKIGGITKAIFNQSENNKTLSSNDQTNNEIKIDEENEQELINPEKTLDKMLKKDIRLRTKSKNYHKNQQMDELFVTRTNLIRKIATNM